MQNNEWEAHKKNFQTMLDAAKHHKRLCLGRALSQTDPTQEGAVICIINSVDDEVEMIPVARMLDDPEQFMGQFTMVR